MTERFAGCLIGQALGDALGFPVEGYPPDLCVHYAEDYVDHPTGIIPPGRSPFPFGQYTDDTQLARELLQSYLGRGAFDPADYATRIANIFAQNRIVGWGQATRSAALRLIEGISWEHAGTPPPAAGNGSAMRAAPIGLLFHDDPLSLVRSSVDQSRITHQDTRCCAGAVAIATAVSYVIRSHSIDALEMIGEICEATQIVDVGFSDSIEQLLSIHHLQLDEARDRVARLGLAVDERPDWQGISPFVIPSVAWSFYAFLNSSEDYLATVATAISGGGDTDTTAAMAGAISGAHLGLSGIPSSLARHVKDRDTWDFDDLIALANQAASLHSS